MCNLERLMGNIFYQIWGKTYYQLDIKELRKIENIIYNSSSSSDKMTQNFYFRE